MNTTMPATHQSTVVEIVPMTVTPHLEILLCGHAGLLHPPEVTPGMAHRGNPRVSDVQMGPGGTKR